jgi:hypothetical protein
LLLLQQLTCYFFTARARPTKDRKWRQIKGKHQREEEKEKKNKEELASALDHGGNI